MKRFRKISPASAQQTSEEEPKPAPLTVQGLLAEESAMNRFRKISPAPAQQTSEEIAEEEFFEASNSSVAETIKCFFCRFEAYDRMEFFLHMKEEHVVDPSMKGNICEEEFKQEELLKKHYVKDHYTCKLCG